MLYGWAAYAPWAWVCYMSWWILYNPRPPILLLTCCLLSSLSSGDHKKLKPCRQPRCHASQVQVEKKQKPNRKPQIALGVIKQKQKQGRPGSVSSFPAKNTGVRSSVVVSSHCMWLLAFESNLVSDGKLRAISVAFASVFFPSGFLKSLQNFFCLEYMSPPQKTNPKQNKQTKVK